jgi:hypothetical protein
MDLMTKCFRTPRRFAVLLVIAPIAFSALGCGLTGSPVAGRVVELRDLNAGWQDKNLLPVVGALVVVNWSGTVPALGGGFSDCFETQLMTTDDAGRFSTGRRFFSPQPYPVIKMRVFGVAYKPGFKTLQGWSSETNPTDSLIFLERVHSEDQDEQIHSLWALAQAGCDYVNGDRNLSSWYRALYEEASMLKPSNLTARFKLDDTFASAHS